MKDKELTFVVSGMLWQRSLVMMDLETRSLWAHLLGRAMSGRLKGEELEALPSVMTDWRTWRDTHPDTTVLNLTRTSREYQREFFRDPSQFVVGMAMGNAARAWPFDQLRRQQIVNDGFDGRPVVIAFMADSGTAVVFNRRINGRTLSFSNVDGKLLDDQTGTQWHPVNGRALAGPLAGNELAAEASTISYRRAWQDFHPTSSFWRAE